MKKSNSLPIIEIHNTGHVLQNQTSLIGWYVRVNWQCFAKNRQNNIRNPGVRNWPKTFWAVYMPTYVMPIDDVI